MSQNQEPDQYQDEAQAPLAASASVAPVAWYARPWFWATILLILLFALFAWLLWKQWQIYQSLLDAQNVQVQKQLEHNAQLEDEAARLRNALNLEPCDVKVFLENQGLSIPLQNVPPTERNTIPSDGANSAPANTPATTPATEAEAPPPMPSIKPATKAEAPPPAPLNKAEEAPSSANSEPLPMVQNLEQATVLIIGDTGKALKTGTGFFIAPGVILTNAHVTQGSSQGIYVVGKFAELATKSKLVAVSNTKGRDYAVLQVPITSVKPLNFNLNIARTQKVSAWGFPGAVTEVDPNFKALLSGKASSPPEVVYSEGTVSVVQDQSPPLIYHTAVVSHGNSGGPLVNEKGEVVGINTYIAMDDKSYRQSSLAIVSKDIVAFLQEKNIPYTISPKE